MVYERNTMKISWGTYVKQNLKIYKMKKIILAMAFVFASGNIINANSSVIIEETNNKVERYDQCGEFATTMARYYSLEGYDYWSVWFNAYGHCIERTK